MSHLLSTLARQLTVCNSTRVSHGFIMQRSRNYVIVCSTKYVYLMSNDANVPNTGCFVKLKRSFLDLCLSFCLVISSSCLHSISSPLSTAPSLFLLLPIFSPPFLPHPLPFYIISKAPSLPVLTHHLKSKLSRNQDINVITGYHRLIAVTLWCFNRVWLCLLCSRTVWE